MDIRNYLVSWSVGWPSQTNSSLSAVCELEPFLAAKTVLSSASLK